MKVFIVIGYVSGIQAPHRSIESVWANEGAAIEEMKKREVNDDFIIFDVEEHEVNGEVSRRDDDVVGVIELPPWPFDRKADQHV